MEKENVLFWFHLNKSCFFPRLYKFTLTSDVCLLKRMTQNVEKTTENIAINVGESCHEYTKENSVIFESMAHSISKNHGYRIESNCLKAHL